MVGVARGRVARTPGSSVLTLRSGTDRAVNKFEGDGLIERAVSPEDRADGG
ncbi:hypothetical protein GCM10009535_26370 [Streptomyces thermocarboxydovorans]|uniref:Uncharacterized protein n=1 Tax=Streptomyces thermocarboxydovorans TaxID=59298 RepID=A0ABP3SKS9_9ACTN